MVVLARRHDVTREPRVQRPDEPKPTLQWNEAPQDERGYDADPRTDADADTERVEARSRVRREDEEWDRNHEECLSSHLYCA